MRSRGGQGPSSSYGQDGLGDRHATLWELPRSAVRNLTSDPNHLEGMDRFWTPGPGEARP